VTGEQTTAEVESVEAPAEATKPLLTVIDAHATPEEVAAIVTVLSALGGGAPAPKPVRSNWAHPAYGMRAPYPSGRGGWRASALPR
jgi:hypothetical protein